MAVTIVNRGAGISDNFRTRWVDITGPASYTTNGETLSAADLKALTSADYGRIGDILMLLGEPATSGHELVLDRTNSKIKFYNGTTEIANAVNLSAVTCRALVQYGATNK